MTTEIPSQTRTHLPPEKMLRIQAYRAVTNAPLMACKRAAVGFEADWEAIEFINSRSWMRSMLITWAMPGDPVASDSELLRAALLRREGKSTSEQALGAQLEQQFIKRIEQLRVQVPEKAQIAYRMAAYLYGDEPVAVDYLSSRHWPAAARTCNL